MGFRWQKRTRLFGGSGSKAQAWVNWSIGVPSVSVRIGPVTLNSKRGLSTVRTPIKGVSYIDRD